MSDLRRGQVGPDVREWQYTLCRLDHVVVCDGDFGPATDAATRALQQRAGLVVDGIVGPKTRTAASRRLPVGILRGVDVSRWQADVDWPRVAAENAVDFAYLKASEGSTLVDQGFALNAVAARKAGLRVGAYHFMTHTTPAAAQATLFLATCQRHADDLPPALDLETAAKGERPDVIIGRALEWLTLVDAVVGVRPVLYTYSRFGTNLRGPLAAQLAKYPLWIAHYGVRSPVVPAPWRDWVIWQTSSSGRIAGITGNVDLNVMRKGSL